jgi:hypothetical protein
MPEIYWSTQELDVACFVVKSPDGRLTYLKRYIFDSVLSIFGIDVKENIRFLITFADNELPLILTAIKKAELPCQMDAEGLPCHQKFNNGAIYSNNQDAKDSIPSNLWKDGMENFELFFDELSDMPTKSLQMTQEVLLTRRGLEIQLDHGLKDINSQLFKAEHLRTVEGIIAQNKDKFDTNGDKKIEIPVLKKRIVAVDEKSALNCTKCKVTCHYPCKPIPLSKPFCPAFIETRKIKSIIPIIHKIYQYGSKPSLSGVEDVVDAVSSLLSVTCLVCPGKCSMSDHKNENTRWELFEENTLMTLRDIGKDYKDAEGNPLSVQGIHDKLKYDIDQLEKNILKAMSEITKCSNKLKEIALRKDPLLTMPEYIDMMIENEKKYPKEGYKKRIESLENILKKAKLYAGAETKTAFEWGSSTNPNDFHLFIN